MNCPCGYFPIKDEPKFTQGEIKIRVDDNWYYDYLTVYICPRCGNIFTNGGELNGTKSTREKDS